ncbi:SigE family RNA polymerase sigma factor [Pseudonocardia sp. TRM90224]|uniref:SigE family RNA polymerase sigma factor n=1 Tax=Pseudonocardia sp. TRM90224 TaxID=2812678 RepID=UPI001E5D2DB8|nr:SigE family RNA polymerase sigma factor [Pseudonocardia sp. TRM90224]
MRTASLEERQFTEYVAGRLPQLRRTALLLCGDHHRADDIVQIAITRLYPRWRRARDAQDTDAYVRAIVVRSFLNEQRRRWATVWLVGSSTELPSVPSLTSADADVDTREVLRAALDRVPPKQRAVLVLRFLHDLPVGEVAELVGCSEASVKSLTVRGLAALRRVLGSRASETMGTE